MKGGGKKADWLGPWDLKNGAVAGVGCPWVFFYLVCPRLGAGGPRNAIGADKKAQPKPAKGPGKEPPTDTENCATQPVLQPDITGKT